MLATPAISKSGLGWRLARRRQRVELTIAGPLTPTMLSIVNTCLPLPGCGLVRLDLAALEMPPASRGTIGLLVGQLRKHASRFEVVLPRDPIVRLFVLGLACIVSFRLIVEPPSQGGGCACGCEACCPGLRVRSALWDEPTQSPDDLARRVEVSASRLRGMLTQAGSSLRRERLEARMGIAMTRLALDDEKVETIANATGWRSLSWFTSQCREMCGRTPAEVRAAWRDAVGLGRRFVSGVEAPS